MKKLIFLVSALFLLIVFILNTKYSILNAHSSTALAVGDFFIDWGVTPGSPIFTFSNFAPGQIETHTVSVTNSATVERQVGVKGIKDAETGSLGDVLLIEIKKGPALLYGPKSLTQFFSESNLPNGVSLTNLVASETVNLEFKVTFDPNAGNSFQNKSLKFDIEIGVVTDIPTDCQSLSFTRTIIGSQKADNIRGTSGDDLIIGLEGNDKIDGKGGNDCLIGGDGIDKLQGSSGNDLLIGDSQNDNLDGGNGDDTLVGGSGNDDLSGGNGQDNLLGGLDNDKLSGDNSEDFLDGESGDDSLDGGNSSDQLIGGLGFDRLNGRSGPDFCKGEIELSCEF